MRLWWARRAARRTRSAKWVAGNPHHLGELAWQLGGADAFDRIAENDAKGIAPGSNLLESIFNDCSPCLILIDEWVAYLRQIYKADGLPSGSFDANLTFVQSLTEAVKTSPTTVLVAALPASQIEVGGEGGQEALTRLKQTFSRVESSWRPASQEESYEIVRRRLFKEIPGGKYHHRDNTLKQYAKLYRDTATNSRANAATRTTGARWKKPTPSIPNSSISSTRVGAPWSDFNAPAVSCG